MDDREKSALRLNRLQLTNGLKLCASFFNGCYESKIFTQEHINLIKREATDESQISHMLDLLLKRGPDAFSQFVKLVRVDHSWLADKLENTYAVVCKQAQGQEQENTKTTRKTTTNVPASTSDNTQTLCRITVEAIGQDNIQVEVKSIRKSNTETGPFQLILNETKAVELNENEYSDGKVDNSLEVTELEKEDSKRRDESHDLQQENEDKKQTLEMCNKLIQATGIDSANTNSMNLGDLVDKSVETIEKYKTTDQMCRKFLTENDKQKPLEECIQEVQEKKLESMKNEEAALTKLWTTEHQLKKERETIKVMEEKITESKIQQQQIENEKEELKRKNEELQTKLQESKLKFDKVDTYMQQQMMRSTIPSLSATFSGQPRRETRALGRLSSFNRSKAEQKQASSQSTWKGKSEVVNKAYLLKKK